jgi:hypothetical protein
MFHGASPRGAMPSAGGSPTQANLSRAISDASQLRGPSLRSTLNEAGAEFSVELLTADSGPHKNHDRRAHQRDRPTERLDNDP